MYYCSYHPSKHYFAGIRVGFGSTGTDDTRSRLALRVLTALAVRWADSASMYWQCLGVCAADILPVLAVP